MQNIKLLYLIILFAGVSISGNAQTDQAKQNKKTTIDVFTPGEKDQIQIWFNKQTDSLKLFTEQRTKYSNSIVTNLNDIYHLTDTDKAYPVPDIKTKFDAILKKINAEAKPIMNAEQYERHLSTIAKLRKAYLTRLDNPSKETNLYDYLNAKEEKE